MSVGSRVAVRVAASSMVWGVIAGGATTAILAWTGHYEPEVIAAVFAATLAGASASFWAVRRVFARKLSRVAAFVENRIARAADPAAHDNMSSDIALDDADLNRVAEAVDRLLRGVKAQALAPPSGEYVLAERASDMIGRITPTRKDEPTQSTLVAAKTAELEQRLKERALLFEILRESAANQNLDAVLQTIVTRLGTGLRFREVAVLLSKSDNTLVVKAAWGFSDPQQILGRILGADEGIAARAALSGKPTLIPNVAVAEDYLSFWGFAPKEGSFLSAPIRFRGQVLGMLAVTRGPEHELTEMESRYIGALADQTALAIRNAQLFEELELLSTHDELTQLPNRRLLHQRLQRDIADARRYAHPLTAVAIDIDHFKKLNDREGHAEGDAALVALAQVLREHVREVDTVARVGGEEFVVVLSRADKAEAFMVAEKLRRAVNAIALPSVRGQPLGHLSISLGVSQLRDEDSLDDLLRHADDSLYEAKNAGRDRVHVAV